MKHKFLMCTVSQFVLLVQRVCSAQMVSINMDAYCWIDVECSLYVYYVVHDILIFIFHDTMMVIINNRSIIIMII